MPKLYPARRFGRYQIIRLVGRGAMGEVWEARDTKLDRLVALKVIVPKHAADFEYIARFDAEASAAAKLVHPSAIPVYDVGKLGRTHYFTMELVAGESLESMVKRSPLQPRQAARYIRAAAQQIAALHARGFIHRDVKPANILVDGHDHARLTDFGLARRANPDADSANTGRAAGTLGYMAPEQASGRAIDARTDVYGLGATLFHLSTGTPPLAEEPPILRVGNETQPTARRLPTRIPHRLQKICLCCMAEDPAQRYQSAEELAEDLRLFLGDYPIKALPQRLPVDLWLLIRRNRTLAAVCSAAFLFFVFTAVMTHRDMDRSNHVASSSIASLLADRVQNWSAHLQREANEPALQAALRDNDMVSVRRILKEWCAKGGLPSGSASLLDPLGTVTAACRAAPQYVGTSMRDRNYFQGALDRAASEQPVHVSTLYSSVIDQRLRFALAIALRDGAGKILGVLAIGCDTGQAIGIANLRSEDRDIAVISALEPKSPLAERIGVRGAIAAYVAPAPAMLWNNGQHRDRFWPTLAAKESILGTKYDVIVQSPDWGFIWVALLVLAAAAFVTPPSARYFRQRKQQMMRAPSPVAITG